MNSNNKKINNLVLVDVNSRKIHIVIIIHILKTNKKKLFEKLIDKNKDSFKFPDSISTCTLN